MNTKEVFKFGGLLMLQHFLASFYGLSIYIFFNTFGKIGMIGSVLSLFLYICMIHIFTWNRGNKDAVKAHFNHKETSPLFGFQCGLFASIPSVIFIVAFYLTINGTAKTAIVVNSISRIWFGAFIYFFKLVQATPLVYALPVFITFLPFIAAEGYYIGTKDIRLIRKAVYKDQAKFEYPKKDNSAQSVLSEKNMKNLKK